MPRSSARPTARANSASSTCRRSRRRSPSSRSRRPRPRAPSARTVEAPSSPPARRDWHRRAVRPELTPASANGSTGERACRRGVVRHGAGDSVREEPEHARRRARRTLRRRRRGRPPRAVLRQPPGRGPRAADAAAHPRRGAAGLRRARATTAAASTGSRSSPAARGSPSTSTSPARKTCSGSSPDRSPARSSASTEALDPLTADADGWAALRAWVAPLRRDPRALRAGLPRLETDDVLAAVAARTGDETISRIHARLATTTLPPRQLDPVIRLLLECLNHTLDVSGILRSVAPDAYPERARRARAHRRDAPHAVRCCTPT